MDFKKPIAIMSADDKAEIMVENVVNEDTMTEGVYYKEGIVEIIDNIIGEKYDSDNDIFNDSDVMEILENIFFNQDNLNVTIHYQNGDLVHIAGTIEVNHVEDEESIDEPEDNYDDDYTGWDM